MTIDLSRWIRVRSARGGGFSFINQAAPIPYLGFTGDFVFLPTLVGEEWFLTDAALGPLDVISTAPFEFASGAGPSGRDAVNVSARGQFDGLIESPLVALPGAADGLTIEGWVNMGEPQDESSLVQPEECIFSAGVQSSVEANGSAGIAVLLGRTGGQWTMQFRSTFFSGATNGTTNTLYTVAEGISAITAAGWRHYAAEFGRDGSVRLYVQGVPVVGPVTVTLNEGSTFLNTLNSLGPCTLRYRDPGTPPGDFVPPLIQASYIRYTRSRLYNGATFTPPLPPA